MIGNFYKIAFRNILKHKAFSAINIFGLAVGFTAFILISLFIQYEFSWDKHNLNYNRVYLVHTRLTLADRENIWSQVPPGLSQVLTDKIPEFEKVTLMREGWGEFLSSGNNVYFRENDGFYAEPSVFDIFSFVFLRGNPRDALKDPFTIALSHELANKLFPGEDAMGKTVMLEKKFNLKVTAVYKDFPENSHFRPTYLTSLESFSQIMNWAAFKSNWDAYSFRVYTLLKPGADPKIVDKKISGLASENKSDALNQKFFLHPLSKIHLVPEENYDYMNAMFMYGLIALFIVILTSINYINLTIANASIRAKEIAVRKVCGSNKGQLVFQFLSETSILSLIAINFAFFFAELVLPYFNQAINSSLTISYAQNWPFILKMIGWAVLIGVLSGIYPAFVLSSYKSVDLFRSNIFKGKKDRVGLKKVLVSFQFTISIFLIISSIAMSRQVKYMMNKDLGFKKENLLFAQIRSDEKKSFEALRDRLLKHPEITDAAMSNNIPFCGSDGSVFNWEGSQADEKVNVRRNWVSYDFAETMELDILLGREFSKQYQSDMGKRCIINETAWRQFGWSDPIGKKINNGTLEVVGVMRDYHLYSLHNKIPPAILELNNDTTKGSWIYTFRVQPGKIKEARGIIHRELEQFFTADAFELKVYTEYLKEHDNLRVYSAINNTFTFFSVLNILLAVIGLLGLVSFATKRRTKEIGIRKVHGCPAGQIFLILVKDYIILVLSAAVIASPAAYYVFTNTMPAAYKAGMQPWEFIAGMVILLVITLAVTSFHTIKAALTNPVEALRYE